MSTYLTNSNEIQTHNHLVCKWTLDHFAKLAFNPAFAMLGFNLVAVTQTSDMAPASSKEFLDIQANYIV